jgi:hypothetical protein
MAERRSWSWSLWDLSRSDVLCFVPSLKLRFPLPGSPACTKVDSEKLTHTVLYV